MLPQKEKIVKVRCRHILIFIRASIKLQSLQIHREFMNLSKAFLPSSVLL